MPRTKLLMNRATETAIPQAPITIRNKAEKQSIGKIELLRMKCYNRVIFNSRIFGWIVHLFLYKMPFQVNESQVDSSYSLFVYK